MQSIDIQTKQEVSRPAKNALGLFVLFTIAIAFFYPLLFDGKVIFYRDFHFVTYPTRFFLAQAYHQGVIPYWTTNTFGGAPFMATLHPGVFYPPSLFFFLNDFTFALNLYYIFHFLVMGIFTFLLARKWNLTWFAALCCGATGMFGGLILASTLISNYFLSSVWLPLIFWLYYKFEERNHFGWFVGLVLGIATQTLAACPEVSAMTMVLLYFHSMAFTTNTREKSEYLRITITLGVAVILALGLTAFQLAPTAQLLKHTFREGGLDYAFHVNWSLAPSKLTTFILTPDYNEYLSTTVGGKYLNFSGLLHTLYMGIFGFLFVSLGFLFRKEKAVGFWLVIFLFGIFFALGGNNPFYKLVYQSTPLLSFFRYPEKYIFMSSIATIFLIGFCLDALLSASRGRKIRISTTLIFLLLILGATLTVVIFNPNLEPEYSIAYLIIFSLAYVFFYYRKIKPNGFAALLLVMILLDLFVKGFHLLPLIDRNFYEKKPFLTDIVHGSAGKYRVYSGRIDKGPNPMIIPMGQVA